MMAPEIITTSNNGTKIIRKTVGMTRLSHGSNLLANHAPAIIGKIE